MMVGRLPLLVPPLCSEHFHMAAPNEQQPQDGITGLIERVTFHNEETGFAGLRVKAKGHRDLVTVVGTLAAVNAGEWVTAQGRWVRDKEHGLQLSAEHLKCSEPTSREGIEKYLGSGMIKEIGLVYAKSCGPRRSNACWRRPPTAHGYNAGARNGATDQ
jgi:hypothetical protein